MINATDSQRQGYTGAGVRIGVIDTGVDRNHPALSPRVEANLTYVDPATNDVAVDDKVGHGTVVAQLAAGKPLGQWPGGVAPGATVLSARFLDDRSPPSAWETAELYGGLGIKAANEDLANRGARILTNAWGGPRWTSDVDNATLYREYRTVIKDDGALVVFSAGNNGRSEPTEMASLPNERDGSTYPSANLAELERGWIVAAAIDPSDPSQLMAGSNACGRASYYCLVAPGKAGFIGSNDSQGNPTYQFVSDPTYAAALVSGAAALLWEKYPYLNNYMIQQILLDTATDLGAPGRDPVFGRGLLNVGKALGGPVESHQEWLRPGFGGESAWTNPITGVGGLQKSGSGTLSIGSPTADLDYAGETQVNGGTLRVLGRLTRSNVIVASSFSSTPARLEIVGWLGGNVANHEVVHVGETRPDANGINIAGNYLQSGYGSKLSVVLGYDPLHVAGTATLTSGILHVEGVRQGYTWKSREYVLTADGGITGQFTSIESAPDIFLYATAGYSATQAWLDINRLEVTAAALSLADITPAAIGAAQRVEAAFDEVDGRQRDGAGGISDAFLQVAGEFQNTASANAAAASLRSLSGEVHAAAAAATYDTLDLGRRALSSRFDDLSSGARRAGGWMEALGGTASLGSGVDAQVDGWLAGHDVGLDGAMVAGVAFGESTTDSRINGAIDRSRERQTQAQAYLGRQWNQTYVMGQFGAGQWQRQIDRELLLGASTYGVHSDYDGDFAVAGVETGYRFDGAAGTLVPYLGTEHTQVRSDGFQEQGAAGFGLRTGASTSSRTQAIAGLRASRDWQRFSLSGYAEWQQTLASDGLEVSASFVGVDSWSPLAASNPALSGGMFGLSAKAWLTTNSTVSFGYDQRFGPRGDASLVSLKYAFGF
ncbi:S8 family serine peptidase [Pseudoxanthomonas daejeonensis]|uniref:autotransporter serine protease n=1 Tax=Pseudoxanthomonas daejeonensis TaxID=266062 RepID=UPI001F545FC5|nr:autotransporter serine protease [Pseudoxanthomonas daejeonensis]UNK57201.1 S8 family serine peptidase [Pseudoxanthomonas daejeonensis]